MVELSIRWGPTLGSVGLAAVIMATTAGAQVRVAWQHTTPVGTYGTAQTTDLAVAASGSAFVAGFIPFQSGDPMPGLTLMRLDVGGSLAWTRLFPVNLPESTFVEWSPIDGGVVQAANFYDLAVHQYRVALVKYDGSGNVSWSTVLTNLNATTEIRRPTKFLDVDASGNSFVGASSPSVGNSVPRVMSFDSAGNPLFSTSIPLSVGSFTTGATVDVLKHDPFSGDLFVAGHSGFNFAAGRSAYVARLTSAGVVMWVKETASVAGSYVWVRDIGIDAAGRASILAQYSASDGYTDTTRIDLSRRDALGNPAGLISYPANTGRAHALDVDAAGAVVVAGYKLGSGVPGFVSRYDSGLNLVWERTVTIAGSIAHNLEFVTLEANGDATASGLRVTPTFSSSELSEWCVRISASGDQRWLYNSTSGNNANEFVPAHAVDGNGLTWLAVRQYPNPPASSYSNRQITLQLEPQSHSFCHGDGTASACPCGNASGSLQQAGCVNSTGKAGKLVDSGVASVASDTLAFTSSGLDATAIALLLDGSSVGSAFAFGDGILCSGGSLLRLYIAAASSGSVAWPPSGSLSISAQAAALGGPIGIGSKRVYQTYYRDAVAGFCTSGTFNFSNALLVAWSP